MSAHERTPGAPLIRNESPNGAIYGSDAGLDPLERHFSPEVLAQIWQLDTSTVRRMFQDEPGVLKHGKSGRRDGKRDYVTLRIPESVVRRVYREKVKPT